MNVKFKKKAKTSAIFWGIVLIAAAVLLLLDGLHVFTLSTLGLTPWRIFLAVLSAGWLLCEIIRLKIDAIFLPLGALFLLLEAPIARFLGYESGDIMNNWIVVLIAVLLTIGFHIILPRKDGGNVFPEFECGNSDMYFDAADLSNAEVSDIAGSVNVYVSNQENYPGNGTIRINDIAGRVTVHLPQTWLVVTHVSDCVGTTKVPPQTDGSYEKKITLEISDIAGKVEVILE